MANNKLTGQPATVANSWIVSEPLAHAPLLMPTQDLDAEFDDPNVPAASKGSARSVFNNAALAAAVVMTGGATIWFVQGMIEALAIRDGGSSAHWLFLCLATVAFFWISLGAAIAVVGAVACLVGKGQDTIRVPPPGAYPKQKTALLFPIYHEDPEIIAASIRALWDELLAAGAADHFDCFVLSDSRQPNARLEERALFQRLADDVAGKHRFFYRSRADNIGKKAGNVANWVTGFGAAYPHFIVFDADSRMTADTVNRLAVAMEQHPEVGLIQTVPRLRNSTTLFAALQQFANNMFAPVSAAGYAAIQGPTGNYWGHNAIIRTKAFAASAGLPDLPGAAPWGGHIQSHDFVEAALLRRAGWEVELVTTLDGSYESSPPTLIDMAVRDRRWMQGNLQHIAVLFAEGFAPISRLHLGIGIFAYLSSVLWLAMLASGLYLIAVDEQRLITYFGVERSLFPTWPTFDPVAGLRVLSGTLVVVFLPKIAGLCVALLKGGLVWRAPLVAAQMVSLWLAELVIAAAMSPIFMLLHVRGVIEILLGRDSGWNAQRRDGQMIDFGTALQFHGTHIAVGILTLLIAGFVSLYALAWMLPIIVGLIAAPWLTSLTSGQHADLIQSFTAAFLRPKD